MDPLQLRIYALFFLNSLRDDEIYTIPDHVIDFDQVNDESIRGTLAITKFLAKGFATLGEVGIGDTSASEDENGNNDLCIKNIGLDSIDLTADYVADIGIQDQYPVYGDGNISIGMDNVVMEFCTFINFNDSFIDNLELKISYRHKPMSISGVLRHEEFSRNVTKYANAANAAFAMLNTYEPACGSCILSPLIQYARNAMNDYRNNSLSINCPCVEELFGLGSEDIKFWLQFLRN